MGARLEHKLQIARVFRILNQISDDSDEFPYSHFPIFERNEKICRDLILRERKRKIEADQDDETWRRWGQRSVVLVDWYNDSIRIQPQLPVRGAK